MTPSKFIPITLAAACGLALQFQASAANAQSSVTPGTYFSYATAAFIMYQFQGLQVFSTNLNYLYFQSDGTLGWYAWDGELLWAAPYTSGNYFDVFLFDGDGDLQVRSASNPYTGQSSQLWDSGTVSQGVYLILGKTATFRFGMLILTWCGRPHGIQITIGLQPAPSSSIVDEVKGPEHLIL